MKRLLLFLIIIVLGCSKDGNFSFDNSYYVIVTFEGDDQIVMINQPEKVVTNDDIYGIFSQNSIVSWIESDEETLVDSYKLFDELKLLRTVKNYGQVKQSELFISSIKIESKGQEFQACECNSVLIGEVEFNYCETTIISATGTGVISEITGSEGLFKSEIGSITGFAIRLKLAVVGI